MNEKWKAKKAKETLGDGMRKGEKAKEGESRENKKGGMATPSQNLDPPQDMGGPEASHVLNPPLRRQRV